MKKVGDILSRKGGDAITVSPDATVLDALKIMEEKNIGSVIVMSDGKYQGIITERDYSRKIALKGRSSTDTTVADIMSTQLPNISPDDTIERCMELMSDKNIRYLPVFKNNELKGIISMTDVVKETILSQQEMINHLENYIHSNL